MFDDQELDLSTKVRPIHTAVVLLTSAGTDFQHQLPALYKSDQIVYIRGPRRVDPAIHKIYKALGDGQYQLSRHGQVVQNQAGAGPRIFEEGDLQTKVSSGLIAVVFSIVGSGSADTRH